MTTRTIGRRLPAHQGMLDRGRDELARLGQHPAGLAAAQSAVHALMAVLRDVPDEATLFSRCRDRGRLAADCALLESALPRPLVERFTPLERDQLLVLPLRDAAFALRSAELVGGDGDR